MLGMLFYLHEIDLLKVALGIRFPRFLASISTTRLGHVSDECPAGKPCKKQPYDGDTHLHDYCISSG